MSEKIQDVEQSRNYKIYHGENRNDPFPKYVATLMADSLDDAWVKSQNRGIVNWIAYNCVIDTEIGIRATRSTDIGDLIEAPDGKTYIVEGSGFKECI